MQERSRLEALVAMMREVEPALRIGSMFGSPAAFVGRRMAFCAFGGAIGARVPAGDARRLIEAGQAIAFQPFGRSVMREWIELRADSGHDRIAPVLAIAIQHARDLA